MERTTACVPKLAKSADVFASGSCDLHVLTDADGAYRFVSAASLELFGWRVDQLIGESETDFAHPDDVGLVDEARLDARRSPSSVQTTVYRFRCPDETFRWVEAVSKAFFTGENLVVASTVRDIGDRRKTELELQRRATTDPLTGVANRSVFMDRLQHALLRLDRTDELVAVLFLDLDRFKLINDSTGHHVGDAVLLQMAERLLAFLRPEDTLARLGGDEFAIAVEGIVDPEDAIGLAGRIVASGATPFEVGGEQFVCTASVGVAVARDSHHSAVGLLQEADLAMYRAKSRGRDRAELFDEDLRTRAVGRLGTERMLRRAIAEDRLRVEYQPIIDLSTGATVAAEALVRVWDPQREELILAEAFIDVAEETGLLPEVDEWMSAHVLPQAGHWHRNYSDAGFSDVSINVTARDLANPSFATDLTETLSERGLPSDVLQIEVTERVLMEASNSTMSALRALRIAGVRVGLDDFGTGFSSLTYLRLFPLDFVKIDRSFIHNLGEGATERAIVASIITLAHALGMHVVAEGVETSRQCDLLRELGCDRAQGFLFSRSVPASEIDTRFAGNAADAPVLR